MNFSIEALKENKIENKE